jgi:transcriptional regulator with XRE-family HTH domain
MTDETVILVERVMPKAHTYSKTTRQAVRLLGRQIKLARKQRQWPASELAKRAGIARSTLQRIEQGDVSASLGLAFEVATLVGIKLFDAEQDALRRAVKETDERIALLPKHTHPRKRTIQDDF